MLLLSFTQFRRLILACLILPLAMHSTGFAQRSSLPFALRVLYDSFEARMEMVEGEWWLEMPDLIEGTDLPIFAYMDDDDDLTIGVTLGEPYVDVDAAYGQRNSLERWTVVRADDGDLLCFDWIQKYSEEDIVVEFVLSVLELSAFIEGWKDSSAGAEEFLFDVEGCLRGIENAMTGAPLEYRRMFKPEPYCNCLAELVAGDPNLLFSMMDITSPEAVAAIRSCWSAYCPQCSTLGLSFEQVMLGLQEDYEAIDELNDVVRRNFIRGCVNEGMNLPFADEVNLSFAQMESSCECVFEKVLAEDDLTMEDLEDPNGVLLNEMIDECMSDFLAVESFLNEGSSPRGCAGTTRVSAIKDGFAGGWKVKISLGRSEKYLTLDTGASELVINEDWANELKAQGILGRTPIDRIPFILADDSQVYADIYVATRLSIGGCDFYDFKVAVIPEGGMLCGMGVLSVFSSWQLDESNRQLVLTVD